MKKQKMNAFTLVEVLITLVIIGVIAALTVPQLLGKTSGQELVTARNKALSVTNNALLKEYALYGNQPDDNADTLAVLLKNHLSIIGGDGTTFTTADGMYFEIDNDDSFLVDVNGPAKGSNTEGEDVFRFVVDGRKVVVN